VDRLFPTSELTVKTPAWAVSVDRLFPTSELTVSTPVWAVSVERLFPTMELMVMVLPVSEFVVSWLVLRPFVLIELTANCTGLFVLYVMEFTLRLPTFAVALERFVAVTLLNAPELQGCDCVPKEALVLVVGTISPLTSKEVPDAPMRAFPI
jgi:hypothetical protein